MFLQKLANGKNTALYSENVLAMNKISSEAWAKLSNTPFAQRRAN
jgi:hypothetical protein